MSRTVEGRTGGRTIALPIVGLAIVGVLAASLILFAVTFRGPPPNAGPPGPAAVARLLRTGQTGGRGPQVQLTTLPTAPPQGSGQRADPAGAGRIAAMLGVPARDVVAWVSTDERPPALAYEDGYTVGWRTAAGWRTATAPPPPLFKHWHWVTLASMLAATLALALPAWLVARAIARPLGQLADAATQARAGAARPAFPTGGPAEVRALTDAVASMHDRLAQHAAGRTAMLGAIAHDLGTPLTRIAFHAETLPEDKRARAEADIAEMREMLAAVLRFTREATDAAATARVDLGSLLETLVDDIAAAGGAAQVSPGERIVVRGDPRALRRLFTNLIDNAVRYGAAARVGWEAAAGEARVTIADDGPGFGVNAERLLEPFVRGDPSRNRATGGTGLGLAIARDIVEAHGGTIALLESDAGGTVRVALPLA